MSSTYSVGKKAAVIAAINGTLYYALFEQTFESNVFPQTPRWSAIYFGTAAACMDTIIKYSAACEGGCLKERGGDTTPSAYIKHWREALANPVELASDRSLTASFGNGIYKLDPESRPQVEALLSKHGHPGVEGDKLVLQLPTHVELLADLAAAGTPTWRFLDESGTYSYPNPQLGYQPAAAKGEVPAFSALYAKDKPSYDSEFWISAEGSILGTGWHYSTISHLIHRFVRPSEARFPGSAESAIKQIRAVVKEAVPFPNGQRIEIDCTKAPHRWQAETAERLAEKMGLPKDQTLISTTMGDILAKEVLYEFKSLAPEMITFPDMPAGAAQQLDLLAA